MSFFRAIVTVGGMTGLSRITGFMRDTFAANMIGAGPVADAFFVALRFPSLFRSLFAEGAFSAAFVPLYAKAKAEGGAAEALQFSGAALSVLSAILLPFVAVMVIFMPQAIHILAPGFENRPEVLELAINYSRITFPYLYLVSVVALLAGVLNSNKRFAPGAAAPIAFNLFMIAGLALSPFLNGEPGLFMAIAVTLSGFAQWLWMHLHCRALGVAPPFTLPRLTPRVKELFARIGPGALGAGATQINIALSTVLASILPTGAVSHLFYADRLNQLPLGIIGIAIATTLLPVLSARVQAEDKDGIKHFTTRAFELGFILGLPAAIGLGLAATPIVHVLFEHGAFTASDTEQTAAALTAYVIGVLPFILIKIVSALFFAHHDTRTPMRMAIAAVILNIALATVLIRIMGHVGIALATSAATWANFLMLLRALHKKKMLLVDSALLPRLLRTFASAALMAAALYFGQEWAMKALDAGGKLSDIGVLFAYLAGAGSLYLLALQLTGALRLHELLALARREK